MKLKQYILLPLFFKMIIYSVQGDFTINYLPEGCIKNGKTIKTKALPILIGNTLILYIFNNGDKTNMEVRIRQLTPRTFIQKKSLKKWQDYYIHLLELAKKGTMYDF